MKKCLLIANVTSMFAHFELDTFRMLQEAGFEVHVAAGPSIAGQEREDQVVESGVVYHKLPVIRSPFKADNIKAYRYLENLMKKERFDFVHCHTPMGGVLGRLAASRTKMPYVIYTAHGLHMYQGAPLKNWLLYYPVEKWLARKTDVLVTITSEDYRFAQKKLPARHVVYVPGVGIDCTFYGKAGERRQETRRALGVGDGEIMLLSVGELIENKNHAVVLRALGGMDLSNLRYFIAGVGDRKDALEHQAKELGIHDRVTLLGYRTDVRDLLGAADIYLLPSRREGLNASMMEAMAAGLPCICTDTRGNDDLIAEKQGGFRLHPEAENVWSKAIARLAADEGLRARFGAFNAKRIREAFSREHVQKRMRRIYRMDRE